jgi:CCR4-NOT transcription complex subunit 6
LTSLKELLLFDNQLVDLPLELGTLHQLEFLGIEGNPLAEPLRIAMSEKGTQGLIAYFRDNAPVPPPPPPRRWELVDEAEDDAEDAEDKERIDNESFSLLCYNILAQRYATTQTYGYTPSWALEWAYRKDAILHDMTEPGTDVICLQVGGRYPSSFLLSCLDD